MISHIETIRLKEAAEQKVRLTAHEWKHIEECRQCLERLKQAIPTDKLRDTPSAA